MKRRKLLIGLGAVTAGGIAALGTGALSSSEVDRNLTAEVVGDGSAYLTLEATSNYAEISDGGQLFLHFDEHTDGAGDGTGMGLNQDSVNRFDGVFELSARTGDVPDLEIWFEDSLAKLRFYWSDSGAYADSTNKRQINSDGSQSLSIGVEIDLEDYEQTGDIFTGEDDFTIHAESV
ncbi:MAG: DUF1102 domain-containing protein [Halobacteriaceae archaeon]